MAVTLFSYQYGDSPLHRLSPIVKFLGFVGVSTISFVVFPWGFVFSAAIVLRAAFTAHVRIGELFRGCTGIVFLSTLTILSRSFTRAPLGWSASGFLSGLAFGLGLLVSFTGARLFFIITTMIQLKNALDSVPLLWFRRFSLYLTLMLGFLPRFFEKWETAELAYKARAGRSGVYKLFAVTPLVVELMIESAVEIAAALEMRGCE
ncbi:MAG: energy-coupling factor transporter transmembrane protein EcfT [Treponema sp.]|jgi:energy-coupling factor transporter transmembrane protein EcfT|nr:energy-coupling factor transporter transmembrane protein EcfT [Treponema sp.]